MRAALPDCEVRTRLYGTPHKRREYRGDGLGEREGDGGAQHDLRLRLVRMAAAEGKNFILRDIEISLSEELGLPSPAFTGSK